jgi:alginate O-acetyltransferase complex protein AlgI
VAWGALHGGWLCLERWREERTAARRTATLALAPVEPWWFETRRWLVTFHVVCLGWVFFRAESFDVAWTMLTRLITGWGPSPLVTVPVLTVIAGVIAVQFLPEDIGRRLQEGLSRMSPIAQGALLALALVTIDALGPPGIAPFIYFQF